MNAAPDSDGILRRAPVLMQFGGGIYPSLALTAVSQMTHANRAAMRVININTSSLILEGQVIPLDGKANLLLRYRGRKRTFPYISAADVLSGQVPEYMLRDKLVFVGTTALGGFHPPPASRHQPRGDRGPDFRTGRRGVRRVDRPELGRQRRSDHPRRIVVRIVVGSVD
jgi:CHASE2 domain-containing sensor protein